MMNLAGLKEKLVDNCVGVLEDKLHALDKELALLQKSANEETKSNAGDKYETGRAMVMLEKEKLVKQKEQVFLQLKPLKSIDASKELRKVGLGAIVITSGSNYFISSGVGPVDVDEVSFLAVSAMAPITQAMLDKEEGHTFSFNGNEFKINKIC